VAVAFVATLVLLAGGWALFGKAGGGQASPSGGREPSPVVAGSASVVPTASAAGPSASAEPLPEPGSASSGPPADAHLVGAGDIARCGEQGDEQTAALIAGIPGTVFAAGDGAYDDGSATQYRTCYEGSWGQFKDRTRPVPGNHDYGTSDAAGYLAYWGSRARPNGTTWYSFDAGAWHVIMLDSNCDKVGGCGPESAQGRWLAADLAASDAQCTLAIFHHPRWSSGEHGNDRDMDAFWRPLHAAGADLIVNGHDHDYERFAPLDPSGAEDRQRGIREFVVGTGGGVLRQFSATAAHSEFRLAGSYGVIELVLRPSSYAWAFDPVDGGVSDRGSSLCH
jgi:alkaline phosphatase